MSMQDHLHCNRPVRILKTQLHKLNTSTLDDKCFVDGLPENCYEKHEKERNRTCLRITPVKDGDDYHNMFLYLFLPCRDENQLIAPGVLSGADIQKSRSSGIVMLAGKYGILDKIWLGIS